MLKYWVLHHSRKMVAEIVERSKRYSTRAYRAFFVMYQLGLRVSELNRNKWLYAGPEFWVLDTSKNSEVRVFESSMLPDYFIEYLQNPNSRSLMISRSGLYAVLVKSITVPLPVFVKKNTALHIFRYGYIYRLKSLGMSVFEIKELLGHKDIKNTQVYLSHLQNIEL